MNKIFDQIQRERAYQEAKWASTDNQNTEYHWAAYIGAYTNRALVGTPGEDATRRMNFKADMIKVAALAIAAIEKL